MSTFYSLVTKKQIPINQKRLKFIKLNNNFLISKNNENLAMIFKPRKLTKDEKAVFNKNYNYSTDIQSLVSTRDQEAFLFQELENIAKQTKSILYNFEYDEFIYPPRRNKADNSITIFYVKLSYLLYKLTDEPIEKFRQNIIRLVKKLFDK